MPAGERAILDLAAVVIRHHLAAADAAADFDALRRESVAELAPPGDDEIGRPAIERRRELIRPHAGAFDNGLVIAGEKARRVAELVDAQRREIVLEEFFRAAVVERYRRERARADVLECVADRAGVTARPLPGGGEHAAAGEKRRKRHRVIVVRPAVDVGPFGRLVLRVGKFDRLGFRSARRGRLTGQTDEQHAQTKSPAIGRHRRYCPASVATTFQLGSREVTSRANVHTSVTSVTFSALPSITVPLRSRVEETSFETKRTVICAVLLRSSAAVMVAPSIETKRVSAVSPRFSRSVIAASKPSNTSRDNRLRNWRRSPSAKVVTIIS